MLIRKWFRSKQSGVCVNEKERSEIAAALSDGNVVARHKQQGDDREHNGLKMAKSLK